MTEWAFARKMKDILFCRRLALRRETLDDATIMRVGPLSIETLDWVVAGKVKLDSRFGCFLDRNVRLAFERHQSPFISRRARGATLAHSLITLFTVWAEPRGAIVAPNGTIMAVFSFCCFFLLHLCDIGWSSPRLKFLNSPRSRDLMLSLMLTAFLLGHARLWGDQDPFGLLNNSQLLVEVGSENGKVLHALRAASFFIVIATGGVFFNPVVALVMAVSVLQSFVTRYSDLMVGLSKQVVASTQPAPGAANATVPLLDCTSSINIKMTIANATLGNVMPQLSILDFWILGVIGLLQIVLHERAVAEQFQLECMLQVVAARRIDQLGCEKERLGYELRLGEVRLEQHQQHLVEQGQHHAAAAACATLAEGAPRTRTPGANLGDNLNCDSDLNGGLNRDFLNGDVQPRAPLGPAAAALRPPSRHGGDAVGGLATTGAGALLSSPRREVQGGSEHGGGGSTIASCDELRAFAGSNHAFNGGVFNGDLQAHAHRESATAAAAVALRPPTSRGGEGSVAVAAVASAAVDAVPATEADASAASLRPPSVPSGHAVPIQIETELNWPERQRLATLRSLRPPSETMSEAGGNASHASSSHLSSSACGGASVSSGMTGCCATREAVLWRTLRRAGMVSSTPTPPPGLGASISGRTSTSSTSRTEIAELNRS